MANQSITGLTADIVSAYVAKNKIGADDLAAFISSVYGTMTGLGAPEAEPVNQTPKPTPAQIRKSITPDGLISFIDGKPYKTLKRHLTTQGHTFDSYREAYGLPGDYPSTAPNYSKARSEMAKRMGLGIGGRQPPQPARKPHATD